MAGSSNLEVLVTFHVIVVQKNIPTRRFMLRWDSLRTIGDVIDEVASRSEVDKESQFTVIKGGKHLTRGMNLEDAVVLKEDMLHVIIKETTDGHVSSRTRSRTSARASTS